ncbi:MAG TPA: hypothetical protein VGC20_16525 [bacterium]|jgi:hypothetical protein
MTRYFAWALVLFALSFAACSAGSTSSVTDAEKRRPCPPDLTVACGRTPSGNYYRL